MMVFNYLPNRYTKIGNRFLDFEIIQKNGSGQEGKGVYGICLKIQII
jgi:hypothetical protein